MPALQARADPKDMKKYAGRWVATQGAKVIFAADTPKEVSDWLREHDESADLVFRIPPKGESTTYFF